jgi:hypothetical protein
MRIRRKAGLLFGALGVSAATLLATLFACPPGVLLEIDRVRFGMIPNTSAALDAFHSASGHLPTEEEGLAVLLRPVSVAGPYLKWIPTDPWGNALVYRLSAPGDAFSVYSRGRNGVDELGGGDDIVGGAKTYSCEEYGVGCHRACTALQLVSIVGVGLSAIATVLWVIVLSARWSWRQVSRATA